MRPSSARQGPARSGLVVPLRAFTLAKARLAAELAPETRAAYAREWAGRVLDAAGDLDVVVVSSDPEVTAWADARGASVLADPGTLDAAAEAGRSRLADAGCTRVVVVHADLPWARSFATVAVDDADDATTVVLVACHRRDGTNVLSIPAAVPFPFSYGPGSFARHLAAATTCGLDVRVVDDPELAFDVDLPADLERWRTTPAPPPAAEAS